jgi:tetratricopeptide (TPR) repeat protein
MPLSRHRGAEVDGREGARGGGARVEGRYVASAPVAQLLVLSQHCSRASARRRITGSLFDLQDKIAEAVVGMLEPSIQQAELERIRRKPPDSLDAYEHYLRGLALTDMFTRQSVREMQDHCLRAVELDPGFAPSYALAARAYIQRWVQSWYDDLARDTAEVLDLVERGLRADRQDSLMLGTAGHCYAWFARDLDKGLALIDEAIALNPNQSMVFSISGTVRACADELPEAIEHLRRALRLSPRDSRIYATYASLSLCHLLSGNYDESLSWARRAVQRNPHYVSALRAVAAICGVRGPIGEAQGAVSRLLTISPDFTIARFARQYPWRRPDKVADMVEGLRRAGVPEG